MTASQPIRVTASDGYSLAATIFRPPDTPRTGQTILVCSAMGVKRSYYTDFAEHLAARGRGVVTFDYRGIGGSAPPRLRGFPARLRDWGVLDITTMIDAAKRAFPETRLSVVAHSVGGQILGLASNLDAVERVWAVGTQSGYWRHWSGRQRLRVLTLWYLLMPTVPRTFGYFPSKRFGLGESLPAGVAREWAWWGRHPGYVLGRLGRDHGDGYRRFSGSIRALSASDDVIAPSRAVAAFLDFYPAARREHRYIEPTEIGAPSIGHFGYFRESIGQRLWPAELEWLCAGSGS